MMAEKDQTDYTKRPFQLTPVMLDVFEQAKRKKYVVSRRHKLTEAWWHYCALQRMPCVIIRPKRDHATLSMDITHCDFVLSDKHLDAISEVIHESSSSEANITIGLNFCGSSWVILDQAEGLASKMWKITEQARKENRIPVTAHARNHIGKAGTPRIIGSPKPARKSRG